MMHLIWQTEMIEYIVQMVRRGFPCVFLEVTGLYCPGCGGTRAVKALLRGDLSASFRYHPVVVYGAGVVVLVLLLFGLSKLLKKPRLRIVRYEILAYAGLGIILVNWSVKNYYLVVKGIDLLNF